MKRPKIIYDSRTGGPPAIPATHPRLRRCGKRTVVGWREWIALPDFGIAMIQAKFDTGARSSALHAADVATYAEEGAIWVRFHMADPSFGPHEPVWHSGPVLDHRQFRSSGGQVEQRLVIRTRIAIAGTSWPIEVSLTNRADMGVPMLIGRTAMQRRLVVNPDRTYLCSRPMVKDLPPQ